MTVVHYITKQTVLPGGERLIRGIFNLADSYTAGGDPVNLSNYFKSTGSPTVVCASADGYAVEHNQGTAASGTLLAYHNALVVNGVGAASNAALVQVHSAANLVLVNVAFFAFGKSA